MSGITSSLRFSGVLNGDLRKMAVNLVPFPRLHFFAMAQAPLLNKNEIAHTNLDVNECIYQMWSYKNLLANVIPKNGRFLTASCIFRGVVAASEVEESLARVNQKKSQEFVEWIPNNIKTSVINVPPTHISLSSTMIANTTSIKDIFDRIHQQYNKMYKKKAFLHWYLGEGMDAGEFEESARNVHDLMVEYQDKQDCNVNLDEVYNNYTNEIYAKKRPNIYKMKKKKKKK